MSAAPRILMCPPDFYDVAYAINDWMDPDEWGKDRDGWRRRAGAQWNELKAAFERAGAVVETAAPIDGLPDMVFTANCAVVLDGKVLLGRYRYPERRPESEHMHAWLEAERGAGGLDGVVDLSEGEYLEGAGDCVWDAHRGVFWAGYGPRSSRGAHDAVRAAFGKPVISLELSSDRFYHMDVCLMPLSGGELLYLPTAFSQAALAEIRERTGAPDLLIEADDEDAAAFAVNCVNLGRDIFLAGCSDRLRSTLEARGYRVREIDLSAFLMGGGGAFCMTLRLDLTS